MLDENGFRFNVGMILINAQGQSLWARRAEHTAIWQFPQGGINEGETAEEAVYRELEEELGLLSKDVQILDQTQGWIFYTLPTRYQRPWQKPTCIGQRQKWFLLRLISDEHAIKLDYSDPPEFDQWRWVDYWYPLTQVIEFKREAYRKALTQFELLAQARK